MIKKIIKKILRLVVSKKDKFKFSYARKLSVINNESKLKSFFKCDCYYDYNKLFNKVKLNNIGKNFFYSIDIYKIYYYSDIVISNLMLDYNKILDKSFEDYRNTLDSDNYSKELESLIDASINLIDREVKLTNDESIKDSLNGLKERKANSFKDALQRILFLNQLLWQTKHTLNGLGRLDQILNKYYENDIKNKKLTKEEAKELLREFLEILHNYYHFKSGSLYGDTGQIIILGGIDKNGKYMCNDLTYIFIELMEELKLPDPKVLLRISRDVPRDLMELSVNCIKTGIGCPLFANDEVIIPRLIEFGYDKEDVYNYGTAACWEPFITGKSFDQSNICSVSFMEPLRNLSKDDLKDINTKEDFIKLYKKLFDKYFDEFIKRTNSLKFSKDPLLSLFTDDCVKNKKDISLGGAKYNNYGFTGVGLSNLVNSIQVINKYVFTDKKYSLIELFDIVNNNYEGYEDLNKEIKNYKEVYGRDDEDIINLTNDITSYVSNKFNSVRNPLGGKFKFGFSAPSYIDLSKDFKASFDGRKNGEPFNVHISSDNSCAYTELFNFASKLDYTVNRLNGNVIDFFVTPNFIQDNFDKFVDFLILSIKNGFFEMQMNVVSSKILIDAKKNPEKFPNLIVRVWGFSAYFNELPEEYKNYLIERAIRSESNSF